MLLLKELRENNRVTQNSLATHLHVSRSTVAMWESGKALPDIEKVQAIADFFGVTTDYLLGYSSEMITPEMVEQNLNFRYEDRDPQRIDIDAFADLLNAQGLERLKCYAEELTHIDHYRKKNA